MGFQSTNILYTGAEGVNVCNNKLGSNHTFTIDILCIINLCDS